MYSKEEREKAIRLYIKYDKCATDVIHGLGYPDRKTLTNWYKVYLETGLLWKDNSRHPKFTLEQKKAAVRYYLEHGRNFSRTVRALGYPSRETLRSWCDELAPGQRKRRIGGIKLTPEQKKEAVIALCTRTSTAKNIAEKYGVTREALYNWKNDLLPGGGNVTMSSKDNKPLSEDRDALLPEIFH